MPEDDPFVFDTNLGTKVRFLPEAHKHGVAGLLLGKGLDGAILEVIALIGHREHFLVIHEMPMRRKWQARWNLTQEGERR